MVAHSNTPGAFGDPKEPALRPRISRHRDANGTAGPGSGTGTLPRGSPARGSSAAGDLATAGNERWEEPGWRRALQLALAALWLLDAVLQYQNFMFSQGFPRMLAATAAGNPGAVACGSGPGTVGPGRGGPGRGGPGRRPAGALLRLAVSCQIVMGVATGLHADLDALTVASP